MLAETYKENLEVAISLISDVELLLADYTIDNALRSKLNEAITLLKNIK